MERTIEIGAVQIDANPAPTGERLTRADRLVSTAAATGAQLIVLPELFNTGYGYSDENFRLVEPLSGPTVTWLRETAAQHSIHLAGSLMLWDGGEIYNGLLLFAPDGRMWRYDKNYPWGWERGYFRGRKGVTVAETDLGNIGMLICWDTAHPSLWRQYAGQVDLMLISSCPPDVSNPTFVFPDGARVTFDGIRALASLRGTGRLLFGEMVNQQTAWLGVPAVQTVGTGHLKTRVPQGTLSLLTYTFLAPKLLRYLGQAGRMELESDFIQGCKVVDGQGVVQAELEQADGEAFVVAEVELAAKRPHPTTPQPKKLLPGIAYLSSDVLLPLLMQPLYRRAVRRLRRQT